MDNKQMIQQLSKLCRKLEDKHFGRKKKVSRENGIKVAKDDTLQFCT